MPTATRNSTSRINCAADEILNHEQAYAPNADKLTMDGPAPLMSDANGRYPIPMPGQIGKHEYEPNKA